MKDPYVVLGVTRNSTNDEIKTAYRNLAKKYHPDNYRDTNLSELAEEKMKEINEAYDTIQKERSGNYQDSSYNYQTKTDENSKFNHIRILINNGNYAEADIRLNSVLSSERNAEWYFLKGCVLMQRGYFFDAQKSFETACYMDPQNEEYSDALKRIKSATKNYGSNYSPNYANECDTCDLCTSLMCLNCLCNSCR